MASHLNEYDSLNLFVSSGRDKKTPREMANDDGTCSVNERSQSTIQMLVKKKGNGDGGELTPVDIIHILVAIATIIINLAT